MSVIYNILYEVMDRNIFGLVFWCALSLHVTVLCTEQICGSCHQLLLLGLWMLDTIWSCSVFVTRKKPCASRVVWREIYLNVLKDV